MDKKVEFRDLGLIKYKAAWELQEKLFAEVVAAKLDTDIQKKNYLLFCEHEHVYTLGKNGSQDNLLIDLIQLQAKDAEFFRIDRGGDITYHGPGQLVGYPVFNLDDFSMGLKDYIYNLEESIIRSLGEMGIKSERLQGATGVWLGLEENRPRKICAIGVKASRYVTMHGFALNVNTDLEYFNHINPCGFKDKGVTSLQKELGSLQDMKSVKEIVLTKMQEIFRF